MWLQRERDWNWASLPLTGVFETTDGALVLVGAFKSNPLQSISAALELEDLSAVQKFSTFAGQIVPGEDTAGTIFGSFGLGALNINLALDALEQKAGRA